MELVYLDKEANDLSCLDEAAAKPFFAEEMVAWYEDFSNCSLLNCIHPVRGIEDC
jgi:hypothetical protein